ncbi:hypothetical protein BSLG_004689 [Batrachochytrium salamandrivorans]|nr:hypothetical protein BSLG_004689 [Batrachochytrium salamandrivorans]
MHLQQQHSAAALSDRRPSLHNQASSQNWNHEPQHNVKHEITLLECSNQDQQQHQHNGHQSNMIIPGHNSTINRGNQQQQELHGNIHSLQTPKHTDADNQSSYGQISNFLLDDSTMEGDSGKSVMTPVLSLPPSAASLLADERLSPKLGFSPSVSALESLTGRSSHPQLRGRPSIGGQFQPDMYGGGGAGAQPQDVMGFCEVSGECSPVKSTKGMTSMRKRSDDVHKCSVIFANTIAVALLVAVE